MRIGLELSVLGHVTLRRPIDPGLTLIGRNPECDLCLPVDGLAPVQCVLRRADQALHLDNRDSQGTQVGDQVVTKSLRLAHGDLIKLGEVTARVEFKAADSTAPRTRTLELTDTATGVGLMVTVPTMAPGKCWPLTAAGVNVGVDPQNDIVLDDPFVSNFHARFSLDAGRCIVRDLDSRNGVFLGEQKLREGEVRPGVPVRLGKTTLVVARTTDADLRASDTPELDMALVGISKTMARVRELVGRLCDHDAPALILGDTGTGKEVVARLLHQKSRRAGRPFVAINCGALSQGLIESELFGHEKGAFTGAIAQKIGAFEAAHRGTLFLDEIGELPLALQPQLLRVLETGEVRRVGSIEPFRTDVRVVAATNRQLEREVALGRFREDLFHRLHVLAIELPPLKARQGDVEALTKHFLGTFTPPGQRLELTPKALERLVAHSWPGNVRELRNVVQRAVLLRRSDVIDADDISFPPSTLVTRVQTESARSGRTLVEIERDAIISELRRYRGNKKEAATALGVSRSTIHRKLDELGIDVDALLRQP